ncbi:chromate transporter [Brevibacterium iodinum ATCC 49514]|uniref:Chromate transporter n=1 Tax=Brevibacterium iodinum ATCC 49514 TaxID=1255616 RepID=A0A2H1HSW1_9MICO|nr:chromate efflux transporter [Brevibacterium iodinum]SMX65997.1 chromate transporter [Brevibacterium iodinum ATCC 49514]SUW13510.1 chromate transporter, chromate ion transporter (CHR) family [Brevibacterium iodinum]
MTSAPAPTAEVAGSFLRLGLTSFGGPVAHLGYFRNEFVGRRSWLDDREYADLVALCQMLPGPASSQVGMGLGLRRAGLPGLAAAWVSFTLPSAILLTLFALGLSAFGDLGDAGWLLGLKAAAVAVVAGAVQSMAKTLTPDARRASIAAAVLMLMLVIPDSTLPTALVQIVAIVLGGVLGLVWLKRPDKGRNEKESPTEAASASESATASESASTSESAAATVGPHSPESRIASRGARRLGIASLIAFAALLLGLPALTAATGDATIRLIDIFYRAGALVFGGGHVVLPLLEAELVPTGLVDHDTFLAGYGAAQAVPGPLFTFAAFLGASMTTGPSGILGAGIALLAIFLPAGQLVIGILPFWERLRAWEPATAALTGVNAAVVGLLGAALYDPVFVEGITSPATLALAVAAFVAGTMWKVPAWGTVIGAGVLGWLLL